MVSYCMTRKGMALYGMAWYVMSISSQNQVVLTLQFGVLQMKCTKELNIEQNELTEQCLQIDKMLLTK